MIQIIVCCSPVLQRLVVVLSCCLYSINVINFNKLSFPFQFRSCMMMMLGMGSAEEESSTSQSVTEVSKVGPA